ncbi:hypothetical protein [Staphylococcus kloosii]|jgi:hypothetical protein|uniref:Uncharacterized protein n=1 Tax=Staphylococcus kloosii TaxID=29384 RepID=A0A921GZA9_9STAP|nr:hypothetical protein [Staphylococcus kloosii]AVQ35441.1 hypothetical protein C7J89_04480 [Staphylococcus kloosii]MBF7021382.1 hypothetical protein [Staphylococcus kloosii]PNZ04634.1 hypothetical protein CD136_08785 [Staphylococcus kloosii]PTJ73426.1 hypothetical protein BUZ59_12860 [Staphylococcus kloosii]SUM48492.1 Uncharacterised protein [Staphylococcus kloosii]
MFIDKTETFILNIGGLSKRKNRKQLLKLCRQINFCSALNYTIAKYKHIYALEITLPKQQLPFLLSFLSFNNYTIYQVVKSSKASTLIDSDQLPKASKRFEIYIDGLSDAFIKDKIIDIMNMLTTSESIAYTMSRNTLNVNCSVATFAQLIYQLATKNIDILNAVYCPKVTSTRKERIS